MRSMLSWPFGLKSPCSNIRVVFQIGAVDFLTDRPKELSKLPNFTNLAFAFQKTLENRTVVKVKINLLNRSIKFWFQISLLCNLRFLFVLLGGIALLVGIVTDRRQWWLQKVHLWCKIVSPYKPQLCFLWLNCGAIGDIIYYLKLNYGLKTYEL